MWSWVFLPWKGTQGEYVLVVVQGRRLARCWSRKDLSIKLPTEFVVEPRHGALRCKTWKSAIWRFPTRCRTF